MRMKGGESGSDWRSDLWLAVEDIGGDRFIKVSCTPS